MFFKISNKWKLGEKNRMHRDAKELQKKKIFENLLKIQHHVGDTVNILDKLQTEKFLPDYIVLTTQYGGETVIFYEEENIERKCISVI